MGLKFFLQIANFSKICDGSWLLATETISVLNYFSGLRHTSSTQK